jgi:hypothetical protein
VYTAGDIVSNEQKYKVMSKLQDEVISLKLCTFTIKSEEKNSNKAFLAQYCYEIFFKNENV